MRGRGCLQLSGAVVLYAPPRQHIHALVALSSGSRRRGLQWLRVLVSRALHSPQTDGCGGMAVVVVPGCETSRSLAAALSRLARDSGWAARQPRQT